MKRECLDCGLKWDTKEKSLRRGEVPNKYKKCDRCNSYKTVEVKKE